MEKKKKALIISISIGLIILILVVTFMILASMPNKNIGNWKSASSGYSANLKLYDNKRFELTLNLSYVVGETYQANVTYKGTYNYFAGNITLVPDNTNIEYKGNFGENRLTLRKIENGVNGDFIEFKK